RPDDERLAAARVAADEDAGDARLVRRVGDDVAARIEREAELRDQTALFRAEEAEREEHEIALELEFAARDLLHLRRAAVRLLPLEADAVELLDPTVPAREALRIDAPVADHAFLVRRRGAEDHRPVRPRSDVLGPPFGRPRQE